MANRPAAAESTSSTLDVSHDALADTGDHPAEPQPAREAEAEKADAGDADRTHYGRYEVRRVLGQGGFGRVYLAHDPQLQRDVALKVPRRDRLSSQKSVESFLHEARTAATLKHPALVAVYDIQQDGDDIYIVQEFIDGPHLGRWARSNRPDREQIVRLLIEVVEAVGFAHQHDLVHRDLKPGNVLVDQSGRAHVTDFGLALDENLQHLRRSEVSGTPQYMSPEQVRGLSHRLDGRSDIWSLGVIFYELLTGRRPFSGPDNATLFEEIKSGDPKPPRMIRPDLPDELQRICLKCMAKRQTDRYSSAAELLEDLQVWLQQPAELGAAGRPGDAVAGTSQADEPDKAAPSTARDAGTDQVWPLLKHQPDPRLRSYVLDRLTSHGVDAESLWQRLAVEAEPSARRALILGLGEFADAKLLSVAQQATISAELLRLYEKDPDPGIHGAAEWALKQLDQQAELARVRTALATGGVVGERCWYVTKQGQHTMAILKPEGSFLMGSPVAEAERYEGPTGRNETRHRRRIGRTFALAAHEVTVQQFLEFQEDHDDNKQYSTTADAPANVITWYQAVEYCNWLSRQEGLPEDQWCYDPSQRFANGMRLSSDYLQRTGYRLPTEAEWEFACRAGSATARHYGETATLLGEYAWYIDNSQQRGMLPVGSLKPNDFGLFDMLGNALEWCRDRGIFYPNDLPLVSDAERAEEVQDSVFRVLRGGSFNDNAPLVRSAYRVFNQPDNRFSNNGFRVARTYP